MRIGSGYDVHRLVSGRRLVLGGVEIPFEKGLDGHSDADAVLHSICDALLGAAGLGDIGLHFPDSDPSFKDIDSLILLRETYAMVKRKGFALLNLDVTVFAQRPRISPYREAMARKIAETLETRTDRINIKATTTEGLGAIGKGKGIASMCVALVEYSPDDDSPRTRNQDT